MSKSEKQLIQIENSDIGMLQFCLKVLYEHESDDLAWRLVERFGSVSGIFSASHEELMQIDGMTDRVATFFTVMRPLQRQAQLRAVKGLALTTEREIAEYAAVYFMNEYNPSDVCVCLDKKYRVYHAERLGMDERIRELASIACRRNAQKIVLMRLEPRLNTQKTLPSPDRLKLLIKMTKLTSALGIEFVDYVEYYQSTFFSLRRAIGGNIGLYHVFDAKAEKVTPWKTVNGDISDYYTAVVAHAIEKNLK
ncbi:MAG: hypothetical protein K2K13_06195 [Clostridiales bacterium]|nr:hypothetical protein [Clostridiales bacterium]